MMATGKFCHFRHNTPATNGTRAALKRLGLSVLVEVPAIAVDVLEYNHHPILLLPRLLAEVDALFLHGVVVAPEVVGLQEQESPPAHWFPIKLSCRSFEARAKRRLQSLSGFGVTTTQRLPGCGVSSTKVKPSLSV